MTEVERNSVMKRSRQEEKSIIWNGGVRERVRERIRDKRDEIVDGGKNVYIIVLLFKDSSSTDTRA